MMMRGLKEWYRKRSGLSEPYRKMLAAEESLRESRQEAAFLADLLESSSQPFVVGRPDGHLVRFNSAFAQLTGYDKEELAAINWARTLTPPEWLAGEQAMLDELALTGQPVRYEKEYFRKDGSRVPIELFTHVKRDDHGQPEAYYTFITDITARKRAEDELRANEEKFRLFVENTPASVAMFDLNMRYIIASRRWQSSYGLGDQGLIGRSHYEVFPDIPDRWKEIHKRCLAGAIEMCEEEPFPRLDGKTDWVRWEVRPWHESNGAIGGIIIFTEVITDRKLAEAELLEANRDLQALNRIITDCSGSLDLTAILDKVLDESLRVSGLEGGTLCLLTSEGFLRVAAQRETSEATLHDLSTNQIKIGDCLCGSCARDMCPLILPDREAVLKFSTREALRNEDIRFHAAFPLVSAGKCVGVLCIFTRTDRKPSERSLKLLETMTSQMAMAVENARLYAETREYAATLEERVQERTAQLEKQQREIRENQGALMNIVEDLNLKTVELEQENTERIRTMKELRIKDQMLIQQSRMAAMGEMLGNISHQWRQPLNVLGLMLQELELSSEFGTFSKELLDANIAKAMEILLHLSQTIDDFRNFSAPDKEKSLFKLEQIVAKTVSLIEESFKNQNISIAIDVTGEPQIMGYPNEFGQVILNILMNARDVFQERETSEPRIMMRLWQENNKAVMTIADNAGGIQEEVIGMIFDAYFTTKELGKGTGVGLFMSKNIIEKNMSGSLTVKNTGDGAEFRIEV